MGGITVVITRGLGVVIPGLSCLMVFVGGAAEEFIEESVGFTAAFFGFGLLLGGIDGDGLGCSSSGRLRRRGVCRRWRMMRRVGVRRRQSRLRGNVPLRLFGVEIYVEPFVVLFVPNRLPSLGDFGRRRGRRREKGGRVRHDMICF